MSKTVEAPNNRIMVVEDDPTTRRLIEFLLENDGFKVFGFENGQDALQQAAEVRPDLVVMDLMMPDMDGFELGKELRARKEFNKVPILVLTARDTKVDKYEAFKVGADGFMSKPFDSLELLYSIRAFLRLTQQPEAKRIGGGNPVENGGIRLEPTKFNVTVYGQDIQLTRMETAILHYLMEHPGQVFSAEELSVRVLESMQGSGRSVDAVHAHIRNLRAKIEKDAKDPKILVTMGRKGYYFAEQAA
ncbi:MAG: OmpR [Cyanobacteria bacterium RYN_339]|nr:OmpR [Cyanobacteria bacterium RYN_339]